MSAAHAASTVVAIVADLPLSKHSSWPNCSARSDKTSPTRHTIRSRSFGFIHCQGPSSNARRAARTALSTSSTRPRATDANATPVAGSYVANVSPSAAGTHSPPMSSDFSRTKNSRTSGLTGWSTVAVIRTPPCRSFVTTAIVRNIHGSHCSRSAHAAFSCLQSHGDFTCSQCGPELVVVQERARLAPSSKRPGV
ncbi:Uncharacterised protein [Mycobacteroides abscessus subsp. massiliense]|nr:Uncharacterised protein [Mycobacteroides abscessus subsp. massiliense]